MDQVIRDLRLAVRTLRASRGFTLVALLSLAIGIGATTTVFSLVNSIYLRRPEFPEPERLVSVHEESATRLCAGCGVGTSYYGYHDWKESARSFSAMAVYAEQPFVVGGGDMPERVTGALVSANLFPVLGVSPALGRSLVAEEDRAGAPRVALLADALWRRRFGGSRELVGQAVRINGESYTVIGIMPPDFKFPEFAELWLAIEPHAERGSREERNYGVVARLAAGVTAKQADIEMKNIAASLAAQYPAEQAEWTAGVVSLAADQADEVGPYFWVLQGAVAFVLLIVCANIAGLMVARAAARQREIAIRVATGASRSRLLRQLLTESLLLATVGGALGLLLSIWGIDLASRAISEIGVPYYIRFGMDARVIAFGFAVSMLTGVGFGLLPALGASTPNVHGTLTEGALSSTGGRRRARTRGAIVVTELALALVLLAGAGLMIRTFLRLSRSPSGWAAPERVLLSELAMLDRRFDDSDQVRNTVDALLARLANLPVTRAAVERTQFFAGFGGTDRRITVEGMAAVPEGASPRFYFAVSPDYFEVAGSPLIMGRGFTALDGQGAAEVSIVNDAMASAIWGTDSPIGARIKFGEPISTAPWLTVVGVVRSPDSGTSNRRRIFAYVPFAQQPGAQARLMIRTQGDPLALVPSIRAEIAALNADLPLQDIRTMETELARSYWPVRFYATTLSSMAIFAALLAAIGVWGIVAYAVNLRTREIGIRIALGATSPRVLRMIAAEGVSLAAIGLVLGLAGAAALTRVIGAMLYGTSPVDPLVFSLVALLFAAVALIATLVPARRATRVDPMIALRSE